MKNITQQVTTLLISLACWFGIIKSSSQVALAASYERPLKVVIFEDELPFSFIDREKPEGYSVDVIKEVMDRMGYSYEFVITQRAHLYRHDCEVIDPLLYKFDILVNCCHATSNHNPSIFYTTPYHQTEYSILTSFSNKYQEIDKLNNNSVIIVERKSSAHIKLQDMGFNDSCRLLLTDDVNTGFKLLSTGIADYMAVTTQESNTLNEQKREYKIKDFDANIPPMQMSFASLNKELIETVDAALADMKSDGSMNNLYEKWFEIKHPANSSKTFYMYLIAVLVLALLLSIALLIRTRRSRIKARNQYTLKDENEMLDVSRTMSVLVDRIGFTVMIYDVLKDIVYILVNGVYVQVDTTLMETIQNIHPDDRHKFHSTYTEVSTGQKEIVTVVVRLFVESLGRYVDYEYTGSGIKDRNGEVIKILFYKRNDEEKSETVRQQEYLINRLNFSLKSARLLRLECVIGESSYKIIDSELNEFEHSLNSAGELIDAESFAIMNSYIQDLLLGKQNQHHVLIKTKIHKDDEIRLFEFSAILKYDRVGKAQSIYGILNDVTEIRNYEIQLREKIEQLEVINDNMQVGIVFVDRNGLILDINRFQFDRFKIDCKSQLVGKSSILYNKVVTKEEKEALKNGEIVKFKAYTGTDACAINRINKVEEIEGVIYQITVVATFDKKELTGYLFLYNDITKSYLDKRRIKESESRFRLLLEQLPIPIYLKNPTTNQCDYINLEAKRAFCLSENSTTLDRISQTDNQHCRDVDLKLLKTGGEYIGDEQLLLNNGELRDTFVRKAIIDYGNEKLIIAARMDLTEQRKSAMANKIASASLHSLKAFNWSLNPDNGKLDFSVVLSTAERNLHEVISLDMFIELVHSEDKENFKKALYGLINAGSGSVTVAFRIDIQTIGVYDWWEVRAVMDTNPDVSFHRLIYGITININSQKDIELSLKKSQKELIRLNKQNELILNNIASVIIYIDNDFTVQWTNSHRVFHNKSNKSYYDVGTKCYETFGYNTPCPNCPILRAIESRSVVTEEFDRIENEIYELSAIPVIDNDLIEGVIIKLDNISDRKKLIVDLQSSNQLMSAILEETPSVIFIKDVNNDFRYLSVSNEFCTGVANKKREEIIGFNDFEIFDAETAAKFRKDDLEIVAISHGNIINVGEEVVVRDNETYSFITKKIALELSNQSQVLIGQTTDITDIRRLNESLIIAKEKAEESDRLKMAFLANMSHEIRTPLNAIIGFSELLQLTEDPTEAAEYMNIINVNNELLLRLINDILDLSKIESGSFEIEMSEFDLVKLFKEELAAAQNRCSNPNVVVVGECSLDEFVILFDKNRLLQVIKNFVSNAIKYTEKGTITIKLDSEDGGIKVAVQDTGIGIDESKHYLVFERFEKLDSFAQGTGLGLAISKAIIATLGGKIGFESKKNVGSTFWAWFPCEQIKAKQNNKPVPIKILTKNTVAQDKVKILIAEDIDSNYLLICAFLKDYELTRAYNGQEAVDLCKKNKYDIVLMDMKMPVLDGVEATFEIRKFNDTIPIIAVTANAFEQDRKRAKDAGCSGFVAKPVSKVVLIETINSFL